MHRVGPEEYEDSIFDKVMQIYIKKQGKEILDELSDEDDDKSDLDLDYINKLMDNTKWKKYFGLAAEVFFCAQTQLYCYVYSFVATLWKFGFSLSERWESNK